MITRILTMLAFMLLAAGTASADKPAEKVFVRSVVPDVDLSVLDNSFPVRAFSIALPPRDKVDEFLDFVAGDLVPAGINTLVIRVNWAYDFKLRPELADPNGWGEEQARVLAALCREKGVMLVPLVNLLGHQSWHGKVGKLLEVYPQFDEKPRVALPVDEYKWPNRDRLYCKSYCPNHPDVHRVVFDCVDEIVGAFEAKNFHAGLDEVFDIADMDCPRCGGLDPSDVFAQEINTITAHLASRGVRLWMWADRLIDGRRDASGYGEWSASITNTHRAIDRIDKSVMMCDWHYRDAEQSPVYFAIKGFDVVTCGWERPDITKLQLEDLKRFRHNSSKYMSARFKGYMQTVWSGWSQFFDEYRSGSSKENYAAKNYKVLKELFLEHAAAGDAAAKRPRSESKPVFGQ